MISSAQIQSLSDTEGPLPCPFCGNAVVAIGISNTGYDVSCFRGGECCKSSTGIWPTEAEAIAAWNRRTPDSRALLAEVREVLTPFAKWEVAEIHVEPGVRYEIHVIPDTAPQPTFSAFALARFEPGPADPITKAMAGLTDEQKETLLGDGYEPTPATPVSDVTEGEVEAAAKAIWEHDHDVTWQELLNGRPEVKSLHTEFLATAGLYRDMARAALLAARRSGGVADGWRDIGSAPKDGRYVLVARFGQDGELKFASHSRWRMREDAAMEFGGDPEDFEDAWTDGIDEEEACYPTHWMPLAAAPSGKEQARS